MHKYKDIVSVHAALQEHKIITTDVGFQTLTDLEKFQNYILWVDFSIDN